MEVNDYLRKNKEIANQSSMKIEIEKLIEKYQSKADWYHEKAKEKYDQGFKVRVVEFDAQAHTYEAVAMELRMVLKGQVDVHV